MSISTLEAVEQLETERVARANAEIKPTSKWSYDNDDLLLR